LIETLSGKLKFHIFNPDKYEIESHRNILIVPPDHRKTSEVMTEYEYAEVISHRAKHIENGGPVYVDIGNETDPIVMAEMEILQKKCPLSIRRVHNNLVAELWQVNSMVLP
jgi:DNA-directed RNA polymerase I, II, and III subunit RPABC2